TALAGQLRAGQGRGAGGAAPRRALPGRDPGPRRRGRGLPRAPADRGGDGGAEPAAARGVGPDPLTRFGSGGSRGAAELTLELDDALLGERGLGPELLGLDVDLLQLGGQPIGALPV